MKNNHQLMDKYIDPFSDKAKQLSLEFDTATLNKDVAVLRDLLDNAEKSLDEENDASKAMIYYSLGTAYLEWVLHHRSELLNQSGQSIL